MSSLGIWRTMGQIVWEKWRGRPEDATLNVVASKYRVLTAFQMPCLISSSLCCSSWPKMNGWTSPRRVLEILGMLGMGESYTPLGRVARPVCVASDFPWPNWDALVEISACGLRRAVDRDKQGRFLSLHSLDVERSEIRALWTTSGRI